MTPTKYNKQQTHKTINALITQHVNLLAQCQNQDEQADVLYTLYTLGIQHGVRSILKSLPTP